MNFVVARAASAGSSLNPYGQAGLTSDEATLTFTLCERGTAIAAPPGVLALVCPIVGSADIVTSEWRVRLHKTDISVGDAQARHDILVSARGACIVIAGAPIAWSALGRHGPLGPGPAFMLYPAVHRSALAIARRLLRITRDSLCDKDDANSIQRAHQLAHVLEDLQSGFVAMVARCPGSSWARKTAVFLRLQRVRHRITACAHEETDVARLALLANYSVGHFITTFHSVFGETPYSTISRCRLENASNLLSTSELGIADIAQAIGFQSRSSFTRAIRKHLGSSATEFREHAGAFSNAIDVERGTHARLVAETPWQTRPLRHSNASK